MLGALSDALAVGKQALDIGLREPTLLTCVAAIALEAKDDGLASTLVPQLPNSPEGLMTRFQYFAARGDWKEVVSFDETLVSRIPEGDRSTVATAIRIASARLGPPEHVGSALESISSDVRSNPRASILVADAAKTFGLEKLFAEAFEQAVSGINLDSHAADRHMVAMQAARFGKWTSVADILDGYVSERSDSEELRTLATALANDIPIRRRALAFLDRLGEPLVSKSYYLRVAGIVHFNRGDLGKAEEILCRSVEADPTDVRTLLILLSTLHRRGRSDEIAKILAPVDLGKLRGTARDKIFLAHELQKIGRSDDALRFAYEVLRGAPNDSDALLAYFGLVISTDAGKRVPHGKIVASDYWVRLQATDGEAFDFVIEKGARPDQEGILDPAHPFASSVIGLRVGDTIEQDLPIGKKKVWGVVELKHKYLHILHHGLEHFEARFPDARGMYRMSVADGDIQPILDEIKATAEQNREIANFYIERHLPLAMVAARLGKQSAVFAHYIRSLGQDIISNLGNAHERGEARDMLLHTARQGAVLDTYTAIVAAELGILDVLKLVFGDLTIPRSTVDDLLLLEDEARNQGKQSMSIGWQDGQFVRETYTAEENALRAERIRKCRLEIETACRSQPVTIPDQQSELSRTIVENFGARTLDAAYVADRRILVSEDLYFRQVAKQACGVDGVWLQVILAFARDNAHIDPSKYAGAIVQLAARRHGYICLDAITLADVFDFDVTDELTSFAAVSDYIGTANCDLSSHLRAVDSFLNLLWARQDVQEVRLGKATGILLEKLVRFQAKQWATVLAFLRMSPHPQLTAYLDRWIEGHFLSMRSVLETEARTRAKVNRLLFGEALAQLSLRTATSTPTLLSALRRWG